MTEQPINCAVTVMLVCDFGEDNTALGFIRRGENDTFAGKLVAPGGKVELTDGELIDGVPYYSVEHAAVREVKEETDIELGVKDLFFFCSLTLPKLNRVVISMYYVFGDEYNVSGDMRNFTKAPPGNLVWLTKEQIEQMDPDEFAPGMRTEALLLLACL